MLTTDNLKNASIPVQAVMACWVVEASMNTMFGWRQGGGWVNPGSSLGYAAAFLAIAVLGAYLPTKLRDVRGWDISAWFMRIALMVPIIACFALSQLSGWRIMGVTMADTAVAREDQAMQGSVTRDRLHADRAALAALGSQPDPAQTKQRIEQELAAYIGKARQTIGEATNNCADPGWAPTACKRVGELRVKLADAERAKQLAEAIERQAGGLDGVAKVAGGNPDMAIVARIVTGLGVKTTIEDVQFWLPVFIVGLLGFWATFGFALVAPALQMPTVEIQAPPPSQRRLASDVPRYAQLASQGGGEGPASSGRDHQASSSHHTINVSVAGQAATPIGGPAVSASHNPVSAGPVAPPDVQLAAPTNPVAAAPFVQGPATPEAPKVPVQRDAVKALVDQLLVFHAACTVRSPEQLVDGDRLFERYQSWADGRAMHREAFLSMFGTVCGVERVDMGGVVHFRGLEIRGRQALLAVG